MTIIHMNAILGEPGAAKNSFSGSSPSRLSDPDNEVGAGSRDKKNRQTPVKPLLVSEFHKHFNFESLLLIGQLGSTQLFRPSIFIGYSIASSSIVLEQGSIVTVICREKKTGLFYRPYNSILGLFIVFSATPAGPCKSCVAI